MATGAILVILGVGGLFFTYNSVAREKIVTPIDAAIPQKPVRGPFTLKTQADIIRVHVLGMAGDKTYAEMPREIQKISPDGKPALNPDGSAIMMPNTTRDKWVTATTLITALHLALLAYAFFAVSLLLGLTSLGIGIVFWMLRRK